MSDERINIFRVVKQANYTVTDNTYIDDDRLSHRATGIMLFCLRQRDTWQIRTADIITAKKEGRDAVRAAMAELLKFNYLRRTIIRGPDGLLSTEWQLHEMPPEPEKPSPGKPTDGKSGPLLSTSIIKREDATKSKRVKATTPPSEIESIYQAYPRKVGKPSALRAIRKAIERGCAAPILLEKTQAWAKACAGKESQYIPHPATWFNDDRFNDLADSPRPKPASPAGIASAATKEVRIFE